MVERRRAFTSYVDDEGTARLSLNPKKWTGVLGLIATVITTSTLIAGIVLSMTKPVVTRWIHEEVRPVQLEMSASIMSMQRDLRTLQEQAVTEPQLDARMKRVEDRLDAIYALLAGGRR